MPIASCNVMYTTHKTKRTRVACDAHHVLLLLLLLTKLFLLLPGLDPAGPWFDVDDDSVRIDKTDAEWVDIIHTNGRSLGIGRPVGDADFFPNKAGRQPGCDSDGRQGVKEGGGGEARGGKLEKKERGCVSG